jgi:hypothetical protein
MSTAATIPMKWAEDSSRQGGMDFCACCGRKLKGKRLFVEVINGGADIAAPGLGPDTSDAGYMGCFAVGPSCARKHFPGFAVEEPRK